MPEGDTLHRIAQVLADALVDQRVVAASLADAPDAYQLVGTYVRGVRARGKNLLIEFGPLQGELSWVLHTHLMMRGSWHLYAVDAPWRKPASQARVVLKTERSIAVCFLAPIVRLLTPAALARDRQLGSLGPDLLSESFDAETALRLLSALRELPIGVALMRQSTLAGIGNVYKSEVLFHCGVSPFSKVSELSQETLRALVVEARRCMQRNVATTARNPGAGLRFAIAGRRTSHALARSYDVYGRSGEPCPRCSDTIRMRRQGDQGRSTYFCPRCQAPAAARRSERHDGS